MAVALLLLAMVVPLATSVAKKNKAKTVKISAEIDMYKAELAEPLDIEVEPMDALPELEPFWVDMVDSGEVDEDGEGVYIAVLDTGLLSDWEYFFSEANIRDDLGKGFTHDVYWDPVLEDIAFDPLRDDRGFITDDFKGSGHGTHVTSIITGYNYGDAAWIQGVAPEASIIPVLVLDAWIVTTPTGLVGLTGGTDEMVSAGINYIADLAPSLDGPVIISMSLGGPDPSPMIRDAIAYAIEQGVIVVASAGNEGYAGMGYPGAYPEVISVAAAGWTENWVPATYEEPDWNYNGAFWLEDVPEKLNTPDYWGNNWQVYLEDFSSRPNKKLKQKAYQLDVSTPGAAIVGPYKPYFSTDVDYYYVWGTSQAAPHVSGIAALVLQDNPGLDQGQVEKTLKNGARGLPLPADGAWVFDPWYTLYHFEWMGRDWGAGFLTADATLK